MFYTKLNVAIRPSAELQPYIMQLSVIGEAIKKLHDDLKISYRES